MRLATYISDLLYRYQCIVVPGFGAFLSQSRPARIDHDALVLHPPSKQLSFNAQLHANDGLLAKYIADVEKSTYEDALQYIERVVKDWKSDFEHQKTIHLKNIGELWVNESENIQFQPSESVNYLSASFGLVPVVSNAVTREVLKEKVAAIEEKTPLLFTPEKRDSRVYLRYAAVFLLLISMGAAGYPIFKNNRMHRYKVVQQAAQEQVEKTIERATFFDADPELLPSITLNLTKTDAETPETFSPEALKYHVVAGAFRIAANAEKQSRELLDKGYEAKRAGTNRYGLHIVTYGSFSTPDEALSFLRKVRNTETPEAWLWVSE